MMRTKTRFQLWMIAVAGCALLSGCATDHKQLTEFLATASTSPAGCEEYRVMPPDELTISAKPTEEFNGLGVKVGPDGKAFLPLLGSVTLAGKTTTEIAAEMTENLLDYYEDVQVTVSVKAYKSQRFYVFGEVASPGVYSYTGNDNLLSALAKAKPTRMAWPERINVIRGLDPLPGKKGLSIDQQGELKNNRHKVVVNLSDLIKGDGAPANFMIANNDVIYVPPHPLAKVGLAMQQVLFPIRPMVSTIGAPQDVVEATSSPD